jgi:hypothetical protein
VGLTSSPPHKLARLCSEKYLQSSANSWLSTLSGTTAGWNSSKNDTDLTDGRLRRQMGQTRLDPASISEELTKSTNTDENGVFSEVTSLTTEPEIEPCEQRSKTKAMTSPRQCSHDSLPVKCYDRQHIGEVTTKSHRSRLSALVDPAPSCFSEVNVASTTEWLTAELQSDEKCDTMFRRPTTPAKVSRFHRRTAEFRPPSTTERLSSIGFDSHRLEVNDHSCKSSLTTDSRHYCRPEPETNHVEVENVASTSDRRRTWTPNTVVPSKRSRCCSHHDYNCRRRHGYSRRCRNDNDRASISATHQHPVTYVASSSTSATSAISLTSSSSTALSCRGHQLQKTETSTSSWSKYCAGDDSVASRQRKRALARKLRRFSDAFYGSAGGLQLKIFGHV